MDDKTPASLPMNKLLQTPDFTLSAFPHLYTHCNSGIIITDYDATILDVNLAFTKITGYTRKEAIGQNPRFLHSNYQSKRFYMNFWKRLKTDGHFETKIWNRRKTGDVYPEWLAIKRIDIKDPPKAYWIGVLSEITLLKQPEGILNLAYYDALTQLPNRQLLYEHLRKMIVNSYSASSHFHKSFAILFFDLDRFKAVNDVHGHNMGDFLLKDAVKRIKSLTREMDLFARIGGDEFVLVINRVESKRSLTRIAEKIISALSQLFKIEQQEINIGASIGISIYPTDGTSPDALIQNADKAMYAAKSTVGKNPIVFFGDL